MSQTQAVGPGPSFLSGISSMATSSDGMTAALLGSDNTIRLVDLVSNAVLSTVHGLLRSHSMAADQRLRCLLLHGGEAGGRLQWWDPWTDCVKYAAQNETSSFLLKLKAEAEESKPKGGIPSESSAAGGAGETDKQ